MTSDWALLPPDILVFIFKLLNDEDLCHSSCTCRAWHSVSKTPSLWRRRTFVFRGYCRSYSARIRNITECIRSVGGHIRELTLSCPSPNLLTAYNVTRCVRILFKEVLALQMQHRRSTLQSFVLKDLEFEETWNGFRSSKRQLVLSLTFFLANHRKLKSIDLSNAFITSPFVYRMMEALILNRNTKHLERVHLENFFSLTVSPIRRIQTVRALFWSFSRLKRLSISQSYMVDESILILCSRLRNTLRQIDFYVSWKSSGPTEENSISSKGWKEALIQCPDLKVTFNFDFWSSYIAGQLLPELPLTELNIEGYLCGTCRTSYATLLNRLLNHISQSFTATLCEISLLLTFGNIPLTPSIHSNDLLSFWARCPKLHTANLSQDLVYHLNGPRRQDKNESFDVRRTLRLDENLCVKVKPVNGPKREAHYCFYVIRSQPTHLGQI